MFSFSKILIFSVLLISFNNFVFAQNKNIAVIGKIQNSESGKAVPYAHIINYTNGNGTISDSLGVFKIYFTVGKNKIRISSIGYYTYNTDVYTDSITFPFVIELKTHIYEIMQVEVYPFTKEKFRYEFIHKDIPKDDIQIIKDILKTKYNSTEELTRITPKLFIPLNFKSKIEKQEELLAKIKEYSALKTKNIERMKIITGLKGKELYDFDRFCKFSYDFLKNVTEYYIFLKIQQKYDEYLKMKNKQ